MQFLFIEIMNGKFINENHLGNIFGLVLEINAFNMVRSSLSCTQSYILHFLIRCLVAESIAKTCQMFKSMYLTNDTKQEQNVSTPIFAEYYTTAHEKQCNE